MFFLFFNVINATTFLMYLPYEGTFNQLLSLENGIAEAQKHERMLVVPPLAPSFHDIRKTFFDWKVYFDLKLIENNFNIIFLPSDKNLFKENFFIQEIKQKKFIDCFSYGRWKSFSSLGETAENYTKEYSLEKKFLIQNQNTEMKHFTNKTKDKNRIMCISQTMHLVPDKKIDILSWIPLTNYVKIPIKIYFKKLKEKYSKEKVLFLGIHWRRDDFKNACRNKPVFSSCWQEKEDLLKEIEKRKKKFKEKIVSLIITDEREDVFFPEDKNIYLFKAETVLPNSLEVIVEFYLMTKVDLFLGNKHSTISRTIKRRREKKGMKTFFF